MKILTYGTNSGIKDITEFLEGSGANVTKESIGLGNVDNTSDLNKPISNATQAELNKKADKEDIPDVSGFAKIEDIPDVGEFALKTEIPDVSEFAKIEDIPDVSGLALKSEIPNISQLATKAEIPDVSGFALKTEIPNVTNFATKDEVADKVTLSEVEDVINNIPPVDLSSYATQSYVTSAINEAVLQGGDVEIDLSPYALKSDLTNKVDKVSGKDLSTNDFTNTLKSKLDSIETGAQKNPDLTPYALKSDLTDSTVIYFNDIPITGLRRYIYEVTAVDGEWVVDYSDKGFTRFVNVSFYSIANGTALEDRTIPTLKQGQPTLTSCSGYLMSATSAGLLAAMTLVDGEGKVVVTIEGA